MLKKSLSVEHLTHAFPSTSSNMHKACAVHFNMIIGVREAAGLGSLPAIFTTNMSVTKLQYQEAYQK